MSSIYEATETLRALRDSIDKADNKLSELEYDIEKGDVNLDEITDASVEVVESVEPIVGSETMVAVSREAIEALREILIDWNEIAAPQAANPAP